VAIGTADRPMAIARPARPARRRARRGRVLGYPISWLVAVAAGAHTLVAAG